MRVEATDVCIHMGQVFSFNVFEQDYQKGGVEWSMYLVQPHGGDVALGISRGLDLEFPGAERIGQRKWTNRWLLTFDGITLCDP